MTERTLTLTFWFCVMMTACTVTGVLLFHADITPQRLAFYAVTSLLYALFMFAIGRWISPK